MTAGAPAARAPRLGPVLREEERVTPLELFFDLVFVLAITQCTALMAADPTWEGLARGLLILGVLWWCWVGYAWLTSVVDPEEGAVRIAIFAAMAALLVTALPVPHAFSDAGLVFAISYGFARYAQIVLLYIAGRDNRQLQHSVITGLVGSSTISISLLVIASQLDGGVQGALWASAIVLDMAGPLFFGVVAIVATRKLASATPGREQNSMARDSYSFLHLPMVAGIVLIALGMKKTLAHVDHDLDVVPAAALFGGMALYLIAHVAFRYRDLRTINRQRLVTAGLVPVLIPLATN